MKTDWSKYVRCGMCVAPEGAACTSIDGTPMNRPHFSRRRKINWSLYDDCPVCSQAPGKPCIDTRYAQRTGTFPLDAPHERRKRMGGA